MRRRKVKSAKSTHAKRSADKAANGNGARSGSPQEAEATDSLASMYLSGKRGAETPENRVTGCVSEVSEVEKREIGESTALCSHSTVHAAREAKHPRPGQAVYNGKLDDRLE